MFDLFHVQGQSITAFVQQLRSEGFDARGDIFEGQVGVIVGPKGMDEGRMPIEDMPFPLSPGPALALFFPLWELNKPANRRFVLERKVHEICEARPADWRPTLRPRVA